MRDARSGRRQPTSGSNSPCHRPSGSSTTLSGGAVGWAPRRRADRLEQGVGLRAGRRRRRPVTVAGDRPARPIVTVSPGAACRLAAVCWASSTPLSAPARVRSSPGKASAVARGQAEHHAGAGGLGGAARWSAASPSTWCEADRQRVRGARGRRDEVERPRRVGAGLRPGPASPRRRRGRPGRSWWPGGGEEARRGRPAAPPRRRPRRRGREPAGRAARSRPPTQSSAGARRARGRHRPDAVRSTRRPSPSGCRAARRRPGRGSTTTSAAPSSSAAAAPARRRRGPRSSWSSWPVGSSARIERRAAGEHPCDGDALGLAAGQLLGQRRGQAAELQPVQRGGGPLDRRRFVDSGEEQRQRDVLDDVERRNQARPLEHHARPEPDRSTTPAGRPSRPASRCSRVDLPEPDGPTSATRMPAATAQSTSRTARTCGPPAPERPADARAAPRTCESGSGAAAVVELCRTAGSRLPPARRAGRPRGRRPRPGPGCDSPTTTATSPRAVARNRSRISPSVVESSSPVGSSASTTAGSTASATASPARADSPPESSPG